VIEDGAQVDQAAMWSGAKTSFVSLHPLGATASRVYGMHGSQQGGQVVVGEFGRAALWTGSAAGWVDLMPPGLTSGYVTGVEDGWQAGSVFTEGDTTRATLWAGTAASRIDLHPATATLSVVLGMGGGQQVGTARELSNVTQASVWTGSAASWVSLHPAGSIGSAAYAAAAGKQVGSANFGGGDIRASLWNGSAASWEDLGAALGPDWRRSEAKGVQVEGPITRVVGYASNRITNRQEPIVWSRSECVRIYLQPSPRVVNLGVPNVFVIGVSELEPVSYQWFKDGVAIDPMANPTATTSELVLPPATAADAGSYECRVTKACGSMRSTAVDLDVLCYDEVELELRAGVEDDYSQANGAENSFPSVRLAAAVSSALQRPHSGFDVPPMSGGSGRRNFAHTFTGIPADIVGATLAIRLRAGDVQGASQPFDDTIRIGAANAAVGGGLNDSAGPFWRSTLGPLSGGAWEFPRVMHPLTLDLATRNAGDGTNLLTMMRAGGALDVVVENGTEIDSAVLTYRRPVSPLVHWFSVQPADQIACGGEAMFSVRMNDRATGLSYAWRRNGVPISPAQNPSAATARLELSGLEFGDVGAYDCVVSGPCGARTSRIAMLTVCAPDFNCDGFVDFFDYDGYVQAFSEGVPFADFNGDGFLDFFDYDEYVLSFETGC
jgi:hypothetical protein